MFECQTKKDMGVLYFDVILWQVLADVSIEFSSSLAIIIININCDNLNRRKPLVGGTD